MAVAERNIGAFAGAQSGSALALSQPSGTQSGDLLLAFVYDYHTTAGVPTPPTGWAISASVNGGGGRFIVYSAVSGQGGLTGTSWNFAVDTTTGAAAGGIVGYAGANTSTPKDTSVSGTQSGGSLSLGSATTTVDGDMIVAALATQQSNASYSSARAANIGALSPIGVYASPSVNATLDVFEAVLPAAGGTGAVTVTLSPIGSSPYFLYCIKAAVVVVNGSATLTGLAGTLARGTSSSTGAANATIPAAQSLVARGALSAAGGANATLSAAQLSSANAAPSGTGQANVALPGSTLSADRHEVSADGNANVEIDGQPLALAPGTPSASNAEIALLAGAELTPAQGTLSAAVTEFAALSGVSLALDAGQASAAADAEAALVGLRLSPSENLPGATGDGSVALVGAGLACVGHAPSTSRPVAGRLRARKMEVIQSTYADAIETVPQKAHPHGERVLVGCE